MKKTTLRWILSLTLVVAAATMISRVYVGAWPMFGAGEETSPAWIADPVDNICGLDDPRLLSNPALIDYPRVLDRTPEMQKMRDKHIDPTSPAGIQLRNAAMDRVRNASEKARIQGGYCSVWKRVSHKDGRVVPDLTAAVSALL